MSARNKNNKQGFTVQGKSGDGKDESDYTMKGVHVEGEGKDKPLVGFVMQNLTVENIGWVMQLTFHFYTTTAAAVMWCVVPPLSVFVFFRLYLILSKLLAEEEVGACQHHKTIIIIKRIQPITAVAVLLSLVVQKNIKLYHADSVMIDCPSLL